jgi:hypothetical protein
MKIMITEILGIETLKGGTHFALCRDSVKTVHSVTCDFEIKQKISCMVNYFPFFEKRIQLHTAEQ